MNEIMYLCHTRHRCLTAVAFLLVRRPQAWTAGSKRNLGWTEGKQPSQLMCPSGSKKTAPKVRDGNTIITTGNRSSSSEIKIERHSTQLCTSFINTAYCAYVFGQNVFIWKKDHLRGKNTHGGLENQRGIKPKCYILLLENNPTSTPTNKNVLHRLWLKKPCHRRVSHTFTFRPHWN